MSQEAPLSKYKRHNLLLLIVILAGAAGWFWYDGRFNEKFIQKHTIDNQPDGTLQFNRQSPPFLLMGAALLGIRFWLVKDKKVVADDTELRCGKTIIPYNRIDSIDKTYFESKGFFVVQYRDDHQQSRQLKVSDRMYDNLPAVLDYLAAKIT